MKKTRDDHIERMKRHKVPGDRSCSLEALAYGSHRWVNLVARRVDISMTGALVESDHPIKTGIVWFNDSMCGYKCGIVVWCNRQGARYRAGIQFVGLTQQDKESLKRQMEQQGPGDPHNARTGMHPLVERIMRNRA